MKRRDWRCRTTTIGSLWGADGPSCTMATTTAAIATGRHRVHHNTELAVVGVSRVRVLVRYLSYDKQRQKNKAQNRNRRQNAMPGAAFSAEICLKSCQSIVSVPSIFYRRTHLIGRQRRKGVARLFFAANADSPDSSKLCCHG